MLRQDIYIIQSSLLYILERKKEYKKSFFFFRYIYFCSRSSTGGATANSRVAPFLLGRKEEGQIHRYFSIFFFIYIYIFFLLPSLFFTIFSVGRREKKEAAILGQHTHTQIPSRDCIYQSRSFFFLSFYIKEEEGERPTGIYRRGLVFFFFAGLGSFSFIPFLYIMCVELASSWLVHLRVSHSLATPQPININYHLEIRTFHPISVPLFLSPLPQRISLYSRHFVCVQAYTQKKNIRNGRATKRERHVIRKE